MASSSTGSSNSDLVRQFVRMGFLEKLVVKAIKDNGEDNAEAILETLLTYSATENFLEEPLCSPTNPDSFESGGDFPDDLSDGDSYLGNEENTSPLSRKDELLCQFVEMGYSADETLAAIDNCGLNTPTAELMDFICAAQMAKEADAYFPPEDEATIVQNPTHEMPRTDYFPREKRRKLQRDGRHDIIRGNRVNGDDDIFRPPNPMIGFGIPNEPWQIVDRALPVAATGPPYFYYENVALAPKGVWSAISRFLYDIQPEFVDSLFFCAAARKRGYVHNLPIQNRHPLMPIPPSTIQEALPSTKKWWPSWDPRTKFNCLQTCIGSAKLSERIRKKLEDSDSEPPVSVRQYVLEECRRWNLVWVGRNKVAPLEPDEMEMLLGFPRDHTRGGGISRTDRYKSLGNTFQVDTVGYHLSVLKELFPNGINLLSLFSGIGGAEVALHRLGIPLKNVVSVEISETNRNILRSWWEQTNQRGNLIHIADVQKVSAENLSQWISSFGGFDLVIGGSRPCNNLSGSNRHTRDGLEGEHSSLFFEYCRILDLVKSLMGN